MVRMKRLRLFENFKSFDDIDDILVSLQDRGIFKKLKTYSNL